MAVASVSGLASGLDTASIIDQLIQLEAAGQTRLKSRVTTEQSTLKLLQNLNAKIAALATQAKDLTKAAAWTPLTATSSSDKVTVSDLVGHLRRQPERSPSTLRARPPAHLHLDRRHDRRRRSRPTRRASTRSR